MLFIPADRPNFIARAGTRGADAVILDLEDGVAPASKPAARQGLREAQRSLRSQGVDAVLRVNAHPDEMRKDLEAADVELLAAVLVPKCESAQDLGRAASLLDGLMKPESRRSPGLLALIETPLGVLNAAAIAVAPELLGLVFGSEDYAAAMGAPPDPALLAQPAGFVAMAAAAHELHALGLIGSLADFSDPDAFADIVRRSRAIGMKGAVVIHPSQVSPVNDGFGVSTIEIAQAQRVVDAFEAALVAQAGAVSLDGRMVDQPVYARAKQVLSRAGATARRASA